MLSCTRFVTSVVVAIVCIAQSACGQTAWIITDTASGTLAFGAREVQTALTERGYVATLRAVTDLASATPTLRVVIGFSSATAITQRLATEGGTAAGSLGVQAYAVRTTTGNPQKALWAIGGDAVGAMYGALELAEVIRLDGVNAVVNTQYSPYLLRRGIKFNIPLDVRTPSYSDNGEHAWKNVEVMWDFNFWRDFLDDLARYRYNVVSLWSMHPFPSLVNVPEYPNVALSDVKKNPGIYPNGDLSGNNFTPSNVLNAAVTVKSMTIDEKIAFWRQVMEYGRDRGIQFYIFTWNIFLYGAEGKDGVTSASTATTTDYYRKAVRQTILTYPLLAGIGITSGENMQNQDETWMYNVYGQGIMDAKATPGFDPNRKIRLIHRLHMSATPTSLRSSFSGYTDTFDISYKYSQAHMHSTATPGTGFLNDVPSGMQCWLTVRNDDMYLMRWGDPSFARAYLAQVRQLR